MKGLLSSKDVIESLDIHSQKNNYAARLHKILLRDCKKMNYETLIADELRSLRKENILCVLATDNMDCFAESIDSIPGLEELFDVVLCSSEIGVLKSEDPNRFFTDWLYANGIDPRKALLLDDSAKNCKQFRKIGGRAILVNETETAIDGIRKWKTEISRG